MTTVKFIHSDMPGAPALTNAAGALISLLDTCLVNGFGAGSVDSLVVANNLATATRSAGHSFEVGVIAEIAGATPVGLNGQKRILSATTTTFTFDATGISSQTASGSITAKVAALGWEKTYNSTNLAAYRAFTGSRPYLRVDDTGTTFARVIGYESMTGISTGTGPFPTEAQVAGGGWWDKSDSSNARSWVIVGDSQAFYFFALPSNSQGLHRTHFFGEYVSNKVNDIYDVALSAQTTTSVYSSEDNLNAGIGRLHKQSQTNLWTARSVLGIGSSSVIYKHIASIGNYSTYSASTTGLTFPNTPDNSLVLLPILLNDASPFCFRGKLPGVYAADHNIQGVFAHREYVFGISSLPGRTLRALTSGNNSTLFVDTTGPWR